MGARKRRAADRAGRPAMRSPGRPPVGRREHRQRFWAAIARGLPSEDAGVAAGVSPAVGSRWFREGGGMPTLSRAPCQGATCRSPSEKKSPSSAPKTSACARPHGSWDGPLDHLQGTAPQRRDPWRAAGVSGHDRPVARRPTSRAPQGRQAGCQPTAPELCAGTAGGRDHPANGTPVSGRRCDGSVDGTGAARTAGGHTRGVRSRSPTGWGRLPR